MEYFILMHSAADYFIPYLFVLSYFCYYKQKGRSPNLPQLNSCLTTLCNDFSLPGRIMITVSVTDCKTISQKIYDDVLSSLQFHQLSCSCGHSACLFRHAYYYRSVKTPVGKIRLRICRLKCSVCGKTHAVILSSLIPYSQISLFDQLSIIRIALTDRDFASVMDVNPEIDENNIRYIVKQYFKHWKQRILSENIPLFPESCLTKRCFFSFLRQFMQIKNVPNLLFPLPT